MSEAATLDGRATSRGNSRPLFASGMILGIVLVGLFAFASLVMLLSYSDELRPEDPPSATVFDRSAVGYFGLYSYLDKLGVDASIDPYPHKGAWDGRSIRLYFPTPAFSEERSERIDPNVPGVVILPKWSVVPIVQGGTEVVRRRDPGLSNVPDRVLEILGDDQALFNASEIDASLKIAGEGSVDGFKHLQFIAAPLEEVDVEPVEDETQAEAVEEDEAEPTGVENAEDETAVDDELEEAVEDELEDIFGSFNFVVKNPMQEEAPRTLMDDPAGDVLAWLGSDGVMVLAEPDLLNNQAFATESRARAALEVLRVVAEQYEIDDPAFVFDDSLRRRDTDQNLVKMLTRPPFLAATLCLLAAGALVGWQGFHRFGDPVADTVNALSRGGATLAKSAGDFIHDTGRISAVSSRYSVIVRRQVLEALGLSTRDERRIDHILRRREEAREISPTYDDLERDRTLDPMERVARLNRWKEEMLK